MVKQVRIVAIGGVIFSGLLVALYMLLMLTTDANYGASIDRCYDVNGFVPTCESMSDDYYEWRSTVDPMLFVGVPVFIISGIILLFIKNIPKESQIHSTSAPIKTSNQTQTSNPQTMIQA